MEAFFGNTVLGLSTAAVLALAACGLVLTYTTTGIFNFAHGAIGMLGAFTYWQLHEAWGWPTPLALAAVLLVGAPLVGLGIEEGIMRHLTDASETVRIVVTISLLVMLLGIGLWWWPSDEPHPYHLLFEGHSVQLFGIGVTYHRLTAMAVAVAVALGLRLLLYRTRTGLDMRAAVDSRSLAQLHGARPDRSAALAWVIGCTLAALAGILSVATTGMDHINLTLLVVNAYAAAMFGRLRSLPMTFVGAVVLGLADSYAIAYIPTDNQYFSTVRFAIPAVVLAIVLLVLPSPQLRTRQATGSRETVPRPSWGGALVTAAAFVAVAAVLAAVLPGADALKVSKIVGIALIALSLVPLTGFGGQVSLCQMSFAAIGAIVMAHHGQAGQPWVLVLVALVCAAVGALVALPSIRLTGLYLALSTAAFALFVDSWVFNLPAFDLGPWHLSGGHPIQIKFFDLGNVAVQPLRLPGIDQNSRNAQLIVLTVVFSLLYLVVVAIRRSGFGERLLALKDSPAAAATMGVNLTLLKLGVFALSAAMAGVGGALYAGTLGTVSPDKFALFESLPLLLLTVLGGIGTAGGALFAGLVLGGLPILIATWPVFTTINYILPGGMGVAFGRNPNGAVHDVAARFGVLRAVPPLLAGVVGGLAVLSGLAMAGTISGWTFAVGASLVLVGLTQVAELTVARRAPAVDGEDGDDVLLADLEHQGFATPLTADQVDALDRALGLEGAR